MTRTRNTMTAILSVIFVAVITVSSVFLITAVKADAAAYDHSAQAHYSQKSELPEKTTKTGVFAKSYIFKAAGKTTEGYDWTYKTDNNNVKVKCSYDFKNNKYTFKITGTAYGLNHFTLKYKTSDTKWVSEKMTLFVDSRNNIMRTA